MLNVELTKLEQQDGMHKITGIWDKKEGHCFTKKIIAHPKYMELLGMKDKLKKTSVTRRCICITQNRIPGTGKNNAVQIILPQNQIYSER